MAVMAGAWTFSACGFLPHHSETSTTTSVLQTAPKPPPVDNMFGDCGPQGSQPDYQLNARKNRIDSMPPALVPWSGIAKLGYPSAVGFRFRNQWTQRETDAIARFEGASIMLEGYLVGVKLEVPEPPNCYSREPAERDFHLWLAQSPDRNKKDGIVVEITPRVRATHSMWTLERLDSLIQAKPPVRISGWLMFDQMHPERVRVRRATLWEIHPVTRIEVKRDSAWRTLDAP
jgi:hypothetical protein